MTPSDKTAATVAALSGFGGVTAAVSCCVLPLALAGVGVGASGLASLGPLYHPLSAIALVAVIAGWYLHLKRRRLCATDVNCPPPSTSTFVLLIAASAFVALSAVWPFIERPLMTAFGG
jgi:mercuric ion transport protein